MDLILDQFDAIASNVHHLRRLQARELKIGKGQEIATNESNIEEKQQGLLRTRWNDDQHVFV